MVCYEGIPRHKVAPTTDEEWAHALRYYGADRGAEYDSPTRAREGEGESEGEGEHEYRASGDAPPASGPDTLSGESANSDDSAGSRSTRASRHGSGPGSGLREGSGTNTASPCQPHTPSRARRPLIHHESATDLELPPREFHLYDGDRLNNNRLAQWRQRMNRQFSYGGGDLRVLGGTAADSGGMNLSALSAAVGAAAASAGPAPTSPSWAWPPLPRSDALEAVGAAVPDTPTDPFMPLGASPGLAAPALPPGHPSLTPTKSLGAFERQFNIMETVGLPRSIYPSDSEERCTMMERQRVREHYQREGWLIAPKPSQTTRLCRSRAIRRLGLNDEDESGDRFAVISKYAELAQMASLAVICVLRGDKEIVYAERESEPLEVSAEIGLCGHVVLLPDDQCTVIADMKQDWRFKNNPIYSKKPWKFAAAAPLRYYRPGLDTVDFGMLCIVDDNARDSFDPREQGILQRLANMLVFQLATLQSEIMAKRSSGMYEASINFLRRSLIPDHLKDGPAAGAETGDPRKPAADREKKRPAQNKLHQKLAGHSTRPRIHKLTAAAPGGGPTPSRVPPPPPPDNTPITKSGPRDTKSAKRKELLAESAMFDDAATTLRGILAADAVAIVDMHEHQLFLRKEGSRHTGPKLSKEAIIADFLQGKEWPANIEPVVNYVPRSSSHEVTVLGRSVTPGFEFNFAPESSPRTLGTFVKTYLMTRHFWWDREDPDDQFAGEFMGLMAPSSRTVLATVFLGFDGTLRYATFACWARPPSAFDDSSRLALPFVWIIGATLVSSLALRRIRSLELSQISYSNLQAHELRTPLHQILSITQLLRSSMSDLAEAPQGPQGDVARTAGSLNTLQQIRDLLPFLDAIDTSGKILHGILSNLLFYLDLKAKDTRWESTHTAHPGLISTPSGAPQTLSSMLEDIIREVSDEDKRSRRSIDQPVGHIETIFEIIPDRLGELVTEDSGGALRKALSKVIGNAYRYIEGQGCVEVYVDNGRGVVVPEGCEELAATRRVKIQIVDNGRGMSSEFVREKLGEPWAKEDLFATGSGLSVHLAYRIIDLMGGQMEITSAPSGGCTVTIEVPLPVAMSPLGGPLAADTPLMSPAESAAMPRTKVCIVGFDRLDDTECCYGRLGASLARQYSRLSCDIVPLAEADLVVADGEYEEMPEGRQVLAGVTAPEMVILVSVDSDQPPTRPKWERSPHGTLIRRLRKPVTPTLLQETLKRTSSALVTPPVQTPGADERVLAARAHFDSAVGTPTGVSGLSSVCARGAFKRLCNNLPWKPKGVCVEEAVASLCLGDYFSSRVRLTRSTSHTSSVTGSVSTDQVSAANTPSALASPSLPPLGSSGSLASPVTTPSEEADEPFTPASSVHAPAALPGVPTAKPAPPPPPPAPPPTCITVLVVEDNTINRKILVRIVSSMRPPAAAPAATLKIVEAENGQEAVDAFRALRAADAGALVIAILDINMPLMSGFEAATEMRAIEKDAGADGPALGLGLGLGAGPPAKIIAVTALAGDDDKSRGLVECGMDLWLTKPCPKATLQSVVDDARKALLDAVGAGGGGGGGDKLAAAPAAAAAATATVATA